MRSGVSDLLKIILMAGLTVTTSASFAEDPDQTVDPSLAPAISSTLVSTPSKPETTTTTITTPAATTTAPATTTTTSTTSEAVKAAYNKLISDAGITYSLLKPNLTIVVDQKKAIDALPRLEEQGMINGKIPASDVAAMPVSIAGALIGVSFSAVIIHTEFENDPSLGNLHVQVYLLPPGSLSDADKKLCYSFDFSRALFNKTNWDTVTPKDIMLNSPNFQFSPFCQAAIDKESK